jgi:hypothetical protein
MDTMNNDIDVLWYFVPLLCGIVVLGIWIIWDFSKGD